MPNLKFISHEEDVDELLDSADRPSAKRRIGTNYHLVVIQVVSDTRFVQRSTDVEKPHLKVEDEAFQDRHKLSQTASFHISQKGETRQVTALDLR